VLSSARAMLSKIRLSLFGKKMGFCEGVVENTFTLGENHNFHVFSARAHETFKVIGSFADAKELFLRDYLNTNIGNTDVHL